MKTRTSILFILACFALALPASAEISVTVERNGETSAGFKFQKVPLPSKSDAASRGTFRIIDGADDRNGGGVARLNDGRLPADADEPGRNFFFNAGTAGGRLQLDLGSVIEVREINTYSWHANTRGPQVYVLFGSDGSGSDFNASPARGTDPASCGWKQLARVDTRPAEGEGGGQYGVSIADAPGPIGRFRYLLFDVSPTETRDAFGNTFYSEIDVVEPGAPVVTAGSENETITRTVEFENGKYRFTFDTSVAPDLTEWTEKELVPVVKEWYPRIVALLPSDGYEAPTNVTIRFRDNMRGTPASAGGGRINCNADWFRRNLRGEARGSVVHEMVHIVQSYGRARRNNPNATRMPGWLTEGIPDYIRWFLYEPETKGAEITRRNFERARYDASYRVTGNFLNWVVEKHDKDIVRKLNAAAREGKYNEELWSTWTGRTVQQLGEEWKTFHEQRLGASTEASSN